MVTLPKGPLVRVQDAVWLGDSRRIVFTGETGDGTSRGYIQEIPVGTPQPIAPAGVMLGRKAGDPDVDILLDSPGVSRRHALIRVTQGSATIALPLFASTSLMTLTPARRPFYAEFAWAFDLLIDRPVRKECGVIIDWLIECGVQPGADLLDAGCGTGRYAIELSRRGYSVAGIDASPELIAIARQAAHAQSGSAVFTVGSIMALPAGRYDAILCRGVLNDLVDDDERRGVFGEFAKALRPAGVLILDVRDWEMTVVRKAREPLFRKRVDTAHGRLTFTSVTDLDRENHRLVLSEQHTLHRDGHEESRDYTFVMRCWTRAELQAHLEDHALLPVAWFGAYDPAVAAGCTDRLVAIARASA